MSRGPARFFFFAAVVATSRPLAERNPRSSMRPHLNLLRVLAGRAPALRPDEDPDVPRHDRPGALGPLLDGGPRRAGEDHRPLAMPGRVGPDFPGHAPFFRRYRPFALTVA